LNVRKTDDALKAEQLRLAVTKDEHSLAELKLAIDDSHKNWNCINRRWRN
jgi:hypothetical protein